jgi:hypothetical protein
MNNNANEVCHMMPIRCAALVLLVLFLGAGCISRTTERPRRIQELPNSGQNDNKGTVTTQALLWFWQPEFWRP